MSETYQGTIQKVYEKGGRYALAMDDGNWYGLGYNKPAANDGDKARFQYEMDATGRYRNVVKGSDQYKAGEGPPPKKKSYGGGKGKGGASDYQQRQQYWEDKELRDIGNQQRISYNAAMNTAINVINSLLDREMLKVAGKAADKADAYIAMVEEETKRIFREFQAVPERYDEIIGVEAEAVDPEPEPETEAKAEGEDWAGDDDGWS